MNPIRRLIDAVVGLLPVPDAMGDSRRAVDPRVDPDALEAFGEAQLAQFGVGQGHQGAAPLPTHYAIEDADDARDELKRQVDARAESDADVDPSP